MKSCANVELHKDSVSCNEQMNPKTMVKSNHFRGVNEIVGTLNNGPLVEQGDKVEYSVDDSHNTDTVDNDHGSQDLAFYLT